MGYKEGIDKKQLSLLPVNLDEYVPRDHICRVIHAFTGQIDMATLKYTHAECKKEGRPSYDPRMILNLYIYGYLNHIRSSRRLEVETRRNIEVMWLMDGLTPDDKTISNFRKENTKALRETFGEFVQMCRRLGLYGEEIIVTDGTKFRANNSLKNHYNEIVVKNEQARIEKKINEYIEALEKSDLEDVDKKEPSSKAIKAALDELKTRKERYEELKERVGKEGEVSMIDTEARLMRSAGDGRKVDVGYNVQTVVDSKYHMIVDFEVTNNSSDSGHLQQMSGRAMEILEVDEITNLADKGYYDSEDIAACQAKGVDCLVAKRRTGGVAKPTGFSHDDFIYESEKDLYTCPCGNQMTHKRNQKKNGGKEYRVYANYGACRECPRKSECTSYNYREIWRLPCQEIIDAVDERTRTNKELYRQRQEIIEHVFGTVKAVWGYKQFLCRSKPKVTAEISLAYLAYNMRRTFNIFKEAGVTPVFT